MYQVRLNDSSNNSWVTRICHIKRKLFSCCFNYRSYAKIQNEPADFDSLIWQPRLVLLSHFSCSDNEKPNLRSRRLVVVFRKKANLLALTIFKQKIPISGWFLPPFCSGPICCARPEFRWLRTGTLATQATPARANQ